MGRKDVIREQVNGYPELFLAVFREIDYKRSVPICPSCNATIHTGAEERCPVCGYSLKRARTIFGEEELLFTRVVDEAGALTHSDRMALMETLEDLERRLPPIALGIYLTSHGHPKEFRPHAHWVLNQAVIHHPSFGRREQGRDIEDAEWREEHTERGNRGTQPRTTETRSRGNFRQKLRDILHPYPPPVRQDWMLILVLDVQLELACFSWGYMLDPYVNPERINTAIMGARLHFRERAMVAGLRRVMKAAVHQIAAQSHKINRRLSKGRSVYPSVVIALGGLLVCPALHADPIPALGDDEAAEEVIEATEAEDPASQGRRDGVPGNPASSNAAPRWSSEDYYHLLSGELVGCYSVLRGKNSPPSEETAPVPAPNRRGKVDARVYKLYYRDYTKPNPPGGLIDPQGVLSSPQRDDIRYALQTCNAHSPYKIYVALYKKEQTLPLDMAAGALVREIATSSGEYAVLLLCAWGDTLQVEIGYHELKPTDEQRHEWQNLVQETAQNYGGTAGIIAALEVLKKVLAPITADLPPLEQRTDLQVPLLPIELQKDEEAEEVSSLDEIKEWLANSSARRVLETIGGILFFFLLIVLWRWHRRRSGHLMETEPDVRLSSPYGAGVSRNVHYLEGRESGSAPRFF